VPTTLGTSIGGEPPGRCGQRDMSPERFARIQAWPLRQARVLHQVVRTDSWIGVVKFGSIRRRVPDLMARAEKHIHNRHWAYLDQKIFRVLYGEEGVSPHLHFPYMIQLKEGGPSARVRRPLGQFGRRGSHGMLLRLVGLGCAQHWGNAGQPLNRYRRD
jgi:hypothetical protein